MVARTVGLLGLLLMTQPGSSSAPGCTCGHPGSNEKRCSGHTNGRARIPQQRRSSNREKRFDLCGIPENDDPLTPNLIRTGKQNNGILRELAKEWLHFPERIEAGVEIEDMNLDFIILMKLLCKEDLSPEISFLLLLHFFRVSNEAYPYSERERDPEHVWDPEQSCGFLDGLRPPPAEQFKRWCIAHKYHPSGKQKELLEEARARWLAARRFWSYDKYDYEKFIEFMIARQLAAVKAVKDKIDGIRPGTQQRFFNARAARLKATKRGMKDLEKILSDAAP